MEYKSCIYTITCSQESDTPSGINVSQDRIYKRNRNCINWLVSLNVSANEFPSSFESIVRKILRLLYHVVAHIYHCHFREVALLGLHAHLNCVFAHLTLLNQRFNLIDPKETEILGDLEAALLGKLTYGDQYYYVIRCIIVTGITKIYERTLALRTYQNRTTLRKTVFRIKSQAQNVLNVIGNLVCNSFNRYSKRHRFE